MNSGECSKAIINTWVLSSFYFITDRTGWARYGNEIKEPAPGKTFDKETNSPGVHNVCEKYMIICGENFDAER